MIPIVMQVMLKLIISFKFLVKYNKLKGVNFIQHGMCIVAGHFLCSLLHISHSHSLDSLLCMHSVMLPLSILNFPTYEVKRLLGKYMILNNAHQSDGELIHQKHVASGFTAFV